MKYIGLLAVLIFSFIVTPKVQAQELNYWIKDSMPLLLEDFLNDFKGGFCAKLTTHPSQGCISKEEVDCFKGFGDQLFTNALLQYYVQELIQNRVLSYYNTTLPASEKNKVENLNFEKLDKFIGCYDLGDVNLDKRVSFEELVFVLAYYPTKSASSGWRWSIGDLNADGKITNIELSTVFYNLNEMMGDANLDGCVNYDDLQILLNNILRKDGSWFTGDFNRDNNVDYTDLQILAKNYSKCAVPSTRAFIKGDYNFNGCVEPTDYNVWRNSYGTAPTKLGAGADGNFNSLIDTSDYTIFRDNLGSGCTPKAMSVYQDLY